MKKNRIMAMVMMFSLVGCSGIVFADSAEKVVDTIADMKALNTGTYQYATVLGYTTAGDGGGGQFYYDSGSSATVDNGMVFAPDSGGGRWFRKVEGQINIVMFGAVLDDAGDDKTAIQAAVDYVDSVGGGVVLHPSGDALLSDEIQIPDNLRYVGANRQACRLIPTSNNMCVVRIYGSYGGLENITIDNVSGYTGVSGIRIAPLDENQTTIQTHTNFNTINTINNIKISGCDTGIYFRPGPDVGGADSGCWYNTVSNFDISDGIIGIHMDEGPNASHSGVNRNNFVTGKISNMNTGVHIISGDTNNFISVHFENIDTGTSPHSTPTAVVVELSGPTYNVESHHNKFIFCEFEGCTRDLENNHHDTELWGCPSAINVTGTRKLAIFASGTTFEIQTGLEAGSVTVNGPGAKIDLNESGVSTKHSLITSNAGAAVNYNGLRLMSNTKTDGSQGNTSLPSMMIDIGGYDAISNPGTGNAITFLNRPAGGSWSQIFGVGDDGVVVFKGPTQTTVGSAGGASALPANPSKYLEIEDNTGTRYVIPCYNKN